MTGKTRRADKSATARRNQRNAKEKDGKIVTTSVYQRNTGKIVTMSVDQRSAGKIVIMNVNQRSAEIDVSQGNAGITVSIGITDVTTGEKSRKLHGRENQNES